MISIKDSCDQNVRLRKKKLLSEGGKATDAEKFPIDCADPTIKQVLLWTERQRITGNTQPFYFEIPKEQIMEIFRFHPWTTKGDPEGQIDSSARHCFTRLYLIGMVERIWVREKRAYLYSLSLKFLKEGLKKFLEESGRFRNIRCALDGGLRL